MKVFILYRVGLGGDFMRVEDIIILFILFALLWIVFRKKQIANSYHLENPESKSTVSKLLESKGYIIKAGKNRIPIDISTPERKYQSRIIIDLIVEKDDKIYVVKIKNKRKQERLSGSFLRDELLKLQLLFHADGIIYIDSEKELLQEVTFDYPTINYRQSILDYFRVPKWVVFIIAVGGLIFFLR